MDSKIREELKNELKLNALKFGDFVLASGKKSTYYINCKKVTLDAKGSYLSGLGLLDLIPQDCKAAGGLTLGADPLVSSLTVLSHQQNRPLSGFLVRKEPKGHGTASQIENCPEKGTKVVIVDDVITTGGSALKAAEIAQESGLDVVLAICLVDRMEGGKEAFEKIGVKMKSIFTINELLENR
ncbi:MAG: hypothetical protein ACD_79C00750G0004 [uncultured bacterium]|nr:MAG: hypothetical protein ACD_79C00750G0004 [uncultured bacterium]